MENKKAPYKGLGVLQLFFIYLAISKALYWVGIFTSLSGFNEFGSFFVERMLSQDLLVILALTAMYFLDKKIFSKTGENDLIANIKLYSIGLVIIVALVSAYLLILRLFFEIVIDSWLRFIIELIIIYAILSCFLFIKEKVKKKETEIYRTDTTDDAEKLAMLKTLCEEGLLTSEEYTAKVGMLEN